MKFRSKMLAGIAAVLAIVLHFYGCTPQSTQPQNQPNVTVVQPLETKKISEQQANSTLKIHNFKFDPAILKIHVGETVKFINGDEEPHTVTAQDGSFDSKALDKDEAWTYTFTKTGKIPYICAIHPFMKGTVTVTPKGGKNET
ncbi:MAG: cupredoxin family copper-binding protein [Stigonema ocellatum SAG 48.90 = DSM 106950]|nr:cupredoxin family copper-binding protein [Stigonema ocellatum SAG 48.90 = DSM 106950]